MNRNMIHIFGKEQGILTLLSTEKQQEAVSVSSFSIEKGRVGNQFVNLNVTGWEVSAIGREIVLHKTTCKNNFEALNN